MRRRLLVVALAARVVVVAGVLGACDEEVSGGTGAAPADGATSEGRRQDAATVGLVCRAAGAAGRGDIQAAAATFADAHTALHELAALAGATDRRRAAVARLLEAKQEVEADLEGGGTLASDLARDLRRLAATVGDVAGEPVPPSCR